MKAASLSGLLLASKGDAKPALAPAADAVAPLVAGQLAAEQPRVARWTSPAQSPTADISPLVERPVRGREAFRSGGPGSPDGGVRISVRMDRDRHRRLRILAAQRGLSLQQAMIQAIDGLVANAAVQAGGAACACLRDADPRCHQPEG